MNPVTNKTDMKTVIVSEDRQFKRIAINFMNSIAFPAEKLPAANLDELNLAMKTDKNVFNIIIDGITLFPKEELSSCIEKLESMVEKDRLKVLVYVTYDQFEVINELKPKNKNIFYEHNIIKQTYNKVFHDSRASKPLKNFLRPQEDKKENLIAVESIEHIKETIESLKSLAQDLSNIEGLQLIGQRFNGLIGSMAFLGTKPGWKQIKDLSIAIDRITRHYEQNNQENTINKKHIEVLLRAAKCCFIILRDLKEFKDTEQSTLDECQLILNVFSEFEGLKKVEIQNQDEIDSLLEEYKLSS